MQRMMLGLYDLMDETGMADFPAELIGELNIVGSNSWTNLRPASPDMERGVPSGADYPSAFRNGLKESR